MFLIYFWAERKSKMMLDKSKHQYWMEKICILVYVPKSSGERGGWGEGALNFNQPDSLFLQQENRWSKQLFCGIIDAVKKDNGYMSSCWNLYLK